MSKIWTNHGLFKLFEYYDKDEKTKYYILERWTPAGEKMKHFMILPENLIEILDKQIIPTVSKK